LQFFDQEGIRPGEIVTLESVAPYRGTITAKMNGRSVVMGTQVAARIWVTGDGKLKAGANGGAKASRAPRR
ncbi:MAG: FeoA family protein, partial [Tepidiformaceae bacterium]